MKFSTEHVLAALALLALGFAIGRKKAATDNTRTAVVPGATQNTADWWTYAGQWNM